MSENTECKKRDMRIMVAAPASNSGKTAVTCGLIALMKKRGFKTCGFKCGPDYIDPMFHRSVLGVESHNLDVFLAGEEGVKRVFDEYSAGMDAVICEGVMGYYDGITLPEKDPATGSARVDIRRSTASPWHISNIVDLPAILVVRPKGAALSIAALIKGFLEFRRPSNIAGVILNDCSSMYFTRYGKMLEEESGVPVLGYLPHMDEAVFESRHLGLMTAGEIGDLRDRIDRIASTLEETLDLERLVELGRCPDTGRKTECPGAGTGQGSARNERGKVRIAVAKDEAFCFVYEEALEELKKSGADIVFFSPIHDGELPDGVKGIYLPGGYPELHAKELSENSSMLEAVRDAINEGIPTIAECGGFLYLGSRLEDGDGNKWNMAGVFPGEAKNSGRLVRFGYGRIIPDRDSMLFRKGESIPVHEFHYWDTTANGNDMELAKASNGSRWRFGYCSDSLYAGFPHLYMAGFNGLAARFIEASDRFRG